MRTTLIAAAIIAAGAGGYYAYNKQADAGINMAELAYVPADTALFSAQIKPIDLPTYLAATAFMTPEMAASTKAEMDNLLLESELGDSEGIAFGLTLYSQLLDALVQPEQFTELTGVSSDARSMLYMVGAAPVLRIAVGDQAKFLAMFERAEQASGYSATEETIEGATVYRYQLVRDEVEEIAIDLLMRVGDGWATLTVDAASLDKANLGQRLALTQPANNLQDSGYLTDILKKYDLRADGVGYIRSDILANALVNPDSNQLGLDLRSISAGELDTSMAEWQTAECRTDVSQIATLWPGVFFDAAITQADSGTTIASTTLIPTHHQPTLERMQDLRGFIPTAMTSNLNDVMGYVGLGTDFGRLAPNLSQMWVSLTSAKFSCAPLVAAQESMKANNPMAALAVTQMLGGLKGFAAQVVDFDLAGLETGSPDALNMTFSMSGDDIETLYTTLQSFDPNLAALELPAVGETTVLAGADLGLPSDATLHRGANTLALGVSAASEATAKSAAAEAMSKNGFVVMGFNYAKLFAAVGPMMALEGEEMGPEIEALMNTDMQLHFVLDFNKHGFVMNYNMAVAKP
ncbi:MAG: Uncharacterised protein [Pseudidiomarina mangrovi]|nr:MAG: Uncharacterised protein [Pseudidiomarina mangrovi]